MLYIILAQVFGAVALGLICFSYFVKNKLKFFLLQIGGDLFYGLAYFVVDSRVAGLITLLSTCRCVYLYFAEKYNFKYKNHCLIVFILGYISLGIAFWTSWVDIVPIITASMFTVAYACKNLQLLRSLSLIPNIVLIVFNIYSFAFVSSILDLIETIVLIVAIIKFSRKKHDNAKDIELSSTKIDKIK